MKRYVGKVGSSRIPCDAAPIQPSLRRAVHIFQQIFSSERRSRDANGTFALRRAKTSTMAGFSCAGFRRSWPPPFCGAGELVVKVNISDERNFRARSNLSARRRVVTGTARVQIRSGGDTPRCGAVVDIGRVGLGHDECPPARRRRLHVFDLYAGLRMNSILVERHCGVEDKSRV